MQITFLGPIRPYSYCFVYRMCTQVIEGSFLFCETNLERLEQGCMPFNEHASARKYIYVVFCGRMTLNQKEISLQCAEIDTKVLTVFLTWFVEQSEHPAFKNLMAPADYPSQSFWKIQTLQTILMMSRMLQRRFFMMNWHSSLLQGCTRLAKIRLCNKQHFFCGYDEFHHAYIAWSCQRLCNCERSKIRKRMPRAVSIWSLWTLWEQRITNYSRRNVQELLPTIFAAIYEGGFFNDSKTHAQSHGEL